MEVFDPAGRITCVKRPSEDGQLGRNVVTSSDHELLRLVVAGNEDAFTLLYRRHQGRVYRFAFLMSGSAAIADDVTQEVFLVLMREADRYDPARGPLSTYLYGIARNYVLRYVERDRPYVSFDDDAEDGDAGRLHQHMIAPDDLLGELTRAETILAVRRAVLSLPAHYREVIVLCYFHELSCAEAASALGCAVGTINSRLNRARALLVEKLRGAHLMSAAAHERGV
jgi:RNA polymerase sigma-70 factor (ECF subfamily)